MEFFLRFFNGKFYIFLMDFFRQKVLVDERSRTFTANHALSLVSTLLSTTLLGLMKEGDEIGFYTRRSFHTSNFFRIPLNDRLV